jgi:hypothetical protein
MFYVPKILIEQSAHTSYFLCFEMASNRILRLVHAHLHEQVYLIRAGLEADCVIREVVFTRNGDGLSVNGCIDGVELLCCHLKPEGC